MKGIVLAGGSGTRLDPLTRSVSKQLLPIYDKPMIYYPISVLMLAGLRDILVITTPQDQDQFRRLLGDGSQWGIRLSYAVQPSPDGLAQAFLIGAEHLACDAAALVLGDNLFFGHGMGGRLTEAVATIERDAGATLFGYRVSDPERYGVAVLDADGNLVDVEEKPERPRSNMAITGVYFYDADVVEVAGSLAPSPRGELEITDLNRVYLQRGNARLVDLGRGTAWLDTGTFDSLNDAGNFVRTLEARQGLKVGSPEEAAWRLGFLSDAELEERATALQKSGYGTYLLEILRRGRTA